MTYSESALTNF